MSMCAGLNEKPRKPFGRDECPASFPHLSVERDRFCWTDTCYNYFHVRPGKKPRGRDNASCTPTLAIRMTAPLNIARYGTRRNS